MEASGDSVRDVSSLDSSGQSATDHAINASDSNKVVLNTNSSTSSKSEKLQSDVPDITKTPLKGSSMDGVTDNIQKAQSEKTTVSNDQLESEGSSIGNVNNLTIPENVKNTICNRKEQSAEETDGVKEMHSDLINNAGEILVINNELSATKPMSTNGMIVEGSTSNNNVILPNDVSNTSDSCNGIVEQFMNREKVDGLKGMDVSVTNDTSCDISNNNGVETMITDDQLESTETGMEESVNENNITIPDSNCNNILMCNGDTEQSMNQEKVIEIKESNGNSDSPIDNIEPMVTDGPPEKRNVVNEAHSDAENNTIMSDGMEGIRNESVVEAMNKDQSWKTDKVYQKDLRSLKLLCDYGSDSNEDDDEGTKKEDTNNSNKIVANSVPAVNPCPAVHQEYREPEVVSVSDSEDESDSSDETSSTSSATSSSSSDESGESEDECVVVEEKVTKIIPKTQGELGLEDLPPIEDLHITVPESECVEIGKVLNIVDSLVVVQSMKGCPALDLDSVLFLDHGQNVLGEVFDVFGKVGEACYCVRFNSKDHAVEKGVEPGMPVYYAPRTDYSKYVFLADLTKMKGSDASWVHNNEPPPRFLDYSDDEQERKARKGNKPPVRNVEREETQPQAKRFNRRGPNLGGGHAAPTSPRSKRPWATPFNRYHVDGSESPPPSPAPSPGPKPLLRPSSFRNAGLPPPHAYDNGGSFGASSHPTISSFQPLSQPPSFRNAGPPQNHFHNNSAMSGPPHSSRYMPQSSFMPSPPQSHFHNAAAGAPPVSANSSPPMLPPQFAREDFKYSMNIPSPQPPFGHSQMGPNSLNINYGGYRQPPPPPHESQFPPSNIMRPTSIPNPGLFAVEPNNCFKVEAPASFIPNQPPSLRQDFHGSFGGGPPGHFGPQQPVFMNPNVPPPLPPTHPSSSRNPHPGW